MSSADFKLIKNQIKLKKKNLQFLLNKIIFFVSIRLVKKAQMKNQEQKPIVFRQKSQTKPTVSKLKTPIRQLSNSKPNSPKSAETRKPTKSVSKTDLKKKNNSCNGINNPQISSGSPGKTNSLKKQISEVNLTGNKTKKIKPGVTNFKKFVLNPTRKSIAPVQTKSPTKQRESRRKQETESSETDSHKSSCSPFGKSPSRLDSTLATTITANESLIHQLEEIKHKRIESRRARLKYLQDIKHEAKMLEEKKEISLFEHLVAHSVQIPKTLTCEIFFFLCFDFLILDFNL